MAEIPYDERPQQLIEAHDQIRALVIECGRIEAERDAAIARAVEAEEELQAMEDHDKRVGAASEAIRKRSNELLRAALGGVWNALWGPHLELLGDAVDAEIGAAAAEEREACARLCDEHARKHDLSFDAPAARTLAARIRARSTP